RFLRTVLTARGRATAASIARIASVMISSMSEKADSLRIEFLLKLNLNFIKIIFYHKDTKILSALCVFVVFLFIIIIIVIGAGLRLLLRIALHINVAVDYIDRDRSVRPVQLYLTDIQIGRSLSDALEVDKRQLAACLNRLCALGLLIFTWTRSAPESVWVKSAWAPSRLR